MTKQAESLILPVKLTFTTHRGVPAAQWARVALKVLRRRYGCDVAWLASERASTGSNEHDNAIGCDDSTDCTRGSPPP